MPAVYGKSKCNGQLLIFLTVAVLSIFDKPSLLNAQSRRPIPPRPGSPTGGAAICLNPDGKYGRCIPLRTCGPLYQILLQQPINRNSVVFLQKSTCGFSGQEPDVCCLIKDTGKVDPAETSTTATTENPISISTPSSSNPEPTTTSRNILANLTSLATSKDILEKTRSHPNLKLLPTTQNCGQVLTLNNIIGGHDAGLGTHPWMVLLGFVDSENSIQFACGGSLITRNYVLTAAHCVTKLPSAFKLTTVRIGEYDQSEEIDCSDGICAPPVQDVDIQEIIPHENYDKEFKKENDIALLRLKKPANTGPFVAPICLPLPQADIFTKGSNMNKLTVAGWGRTNFKSEDSSNILQEVKVPIITREECNRFYKNDRRMGEIDDGRFCSGGEAGKDSCKGDSGGPIMSGILLKSQGSTHPITRVYQFGIVSIGPARCGSEGQPALYTKISHFMPWILDHIKP